MVRDYFCERCKEKLNPDTAVMLELDQDTVLFHDAEKGIPEGHTSQGGFFFGPACAKAVLAAGGVNDHGRNLPGHVRRRRRAL